MIIVPVALIASALLGLAAGLMFRVWANLIVGPAIAVGSALALASHGFGFVEGALLTCTCLVVSQLSYLIAAFMVSPDSIESYLAEHVLDPEPGENGEQNIGDEHQKERGEKPPWSPPSEP